MFLILAAIKQPYESTFPSIRADVCVSTAASVGLFITLFDNVPFILSSWNFQE